MATQKPTFLCSDDSKNSYGFVVLTTGIDLSAFEKNPAMFWMHQRGKLYGNWENVRVENGALYADPAIDVASNDEHILLVAGQVERNVIRAASIGVEILDMEWSDALGCCVATKSVLEEISLVDVGGNRNAVRLYANGQPLNEDQLKVKLATLAAPPATDTISKPNTPVQMELKKMAVKLGLPDTATEQEVESAMDRVMADKGFKEKYETLSTQVKATLRSEVDTLIGQAISDKRITADQKEAYEKLFAADHESTKVILSKLNKPVDLAQFATAGQGANPVTVVDDVKVWDAHDRAGTLATLKAGNPGEYARLFEQKFGKKPTQ